MVEWRSVAAAAAMLGVSERRVRELIDVGALPAVRVGARSWLVDADAVRKRRSHPPAAGRPLSAPLAWLLLECAQNLIEDDGESDPVPGVDRQLRHRLRKLLAEPAPAERWEHWLSRRARQQRVWIHPGAQRRFLDDDRVHHGGAAAAGALGLSHDGGVGVRVYVDAADVAALAAQYQFADDVDGDLLLMAAPPEAASLLSKRGPVPTAVALADLLESEDSRERSIAAARLESISLARP